MSSEAQEIPGKAIGRDGGAETPQRSDTVSVKELARRWHEMCERADKAGR
jgi:hypothetical protein